MELNLDYLLTWPLGTVELVANLRDIDGVTGLSESLIFELRGSEPELDFSRMPTEFISGNSTTLIVEISDLDGIENMECSVLLKDKDEITLFSQIYHPDEDAMWIQDWTPPGNTDANHTLYFACLDETSLSVSGTLPIRAREGTPPVVTENTTQQAKDETTFSTMILLGLTVIFLCIIATTLLLIGRREDLVVEEEDDIPDDVWAKRDEDSTDDVLTEMAGLQVSESLQWSNTELLEAGWTQEQIDIYREQENEEE